MSNPLKQTRVPVGSQTVHSFPMKPLHLTTGRFMHFEIAFAKEFPKHHTKVNHQTFIRTMPMKRPLMSGVSFHKSAYFVPFRTVWEPFTDFKEDTPHVQQEGAAILGNVPLLSNNVVVKWFLEHSTSLIEQDDSAFDFIVLDSHSNPTRWVMNAFARDTYKLLRALGYGVYFLEYDISGTSDRTQSALPLLCAGRVYLDYFFPNQYAHSGYYVNLDGIFNRQYIYTLSPQDFDSIVTVCRFVQYDSDYFTSAFDSPLGPSDGVVSTDYQIFDVSSLNLGDSNTDYNDPLVVSNAYLNNAPAVVSEGIYEDSNNFIMTRYMHNQLKALDNYIRRHGLSGSRSLERYLADWGVALSADKLRRCYKLGEKHYPLQVSDIMSTADTIQEVGQEVIGAALGDFSGKGVAFEGDFNFDCDSDEFGYLFVINTIIPEVAYYQGVDPNVKHKTRLDFLTGDFDGLGTRPICLDELFVGMKRPVFDYDSIFGFTPLYSEYKTAVDRVSGDFCLDTLNVGLEGWSTLRKWSDEYTDEALEAVHNFWFVLGADWEQYNRIFMDSQDDSDKFVIVHRCNLQANMPALPYYDYFDFDTDKPKIKLEVNGSKSN